MGTELSFTKEDTARKYIVSGFCDNEGVRTWTDGNKAEMLFVIGDSDVDLELELLYTTYTDSQKVMVSVNGNVVEEYVARGEDLKRIVIPKEYVKNGKLLLSLDFPDAVSPKSRGKGNDSRELALAMENLKISAVTE